MKNYFNNRTFFLYFIIILIISTIILCFGRPYTKHGKLRAELNMCKTKLHFLNEIILFYREKYNKYPENLTELESFYNKNITKYIQKNPKWSYFYCPINKRKYLYINKGNILVMDSCYCNELKTINILLKDGTIITAK